MIEKEIQFNEKRDIGKIIPDSFAFIKQERHTIASLITRYVLPFIILYAVALVILQKNVLGKLDLSTPETLMSQIGPVYTNILLFSFFGIFVQALLMATYYSFIEVYIKKGKGNFTMEDISGLLFINSLKALSAALFMFVAVMLGVIFCILPGIFLANSLSLIAFIIIFEKNRLGNAVSGSFSMVNSQWWNTFVLNLVGILIMWAIGFVFTIPSLLAGITVNIFDSGSTQQDLPMWYWVLSGASTVVSMILWIIPYTFLAFQYFNLKAEN